MLKYLVWSWKIGEIVSFVGSSLILSLFLPSCILCKWHSSQPTFFRSFFGNYFPEKFFFIIFCFKKVGSSLILSFFQPCCIFCKWHSSQPTFFPEFFWKLFFRKSFFYYFLFQKSGIILSLSLSLSAFCANCLQIKPLTRVSFYLQERNVSQNVSVFLFLNTFFF